MRFILLLSLSCLLACSSSPAATPDADVPNANGEACASGPECASGVCLDKLGENNSWGQPTIEFPEGYCSHACDPQGECPAGEVCLLAYLNWDEAYCRPGYICYDFHTDNACIPDITSTVARAERTRRDSAHLQPATYLRP